MRDDNDQPISLRKCWNCGRFLPRNRWAWLTNNWPEDEGYSHEPECAKGAGCNA